ncbi:MAG: s-methyl-5-thioribose-1-phosphate isomerase [Eubacteriales bacterium]|nr:s-methyl-5-thioribose-1-phosphate isomerase [Eubacteriales bacterium]
MERMDEGMPFLLRYENVAWYENGKVRILDRRVYPTRVEFVECSTYKEVVQAIKDMVTQSAGPYTAIGMGMALAAYESGNLSKEDQKEFLLNAAHEFGISRPTQANRYTTIANGCAAEAIKAIDEGRDPVQAAFDDTIASLNRRYSTMQRAGDNLAALIHDGGSILTQCYGETIIGCLIRAMRREGKTFRAYCAETRPYMQGARLTASCFADAGIDTTLLTDNMIAYAMNEGLIDIFTSAADTICLDGTIANKVGSMQIAILADHFGIPYYVTGVPDKDKPSGSDIVIEMRDPKQCLEFMGIHHTLDTVKALYPAFDIVPPELITGIVTDRGVFKEGVIADYFKDSTEAFYGAFA